MRLAILMLVCTARAALADEPVRREDASLGDIFHGPFHSSRLFAMPTADVIGAYMMSIGGDGSLLQQPGRLTSAIEIAIGFGDIAQLEYRETAAISVTGVDAPVPAAGVQIKVPLPDGPGIPAIGLAFHVGVARTEQVGAAQVTEKVTDIYLVARERLSTAWTLHGGVRLSPSTFDVTGEAEQKTTLVLPTAGFELLSSAATHVVGEASIVPRFEYMAGMAPRIERGVLARLGLRWALVPAVIFDASMGYQLETAAVSAQGPRDIVQQWDIRLGAEVFVPWGALACRAVGAFCD